MPVFIAGCGRSGTSYLRTLIDAHPMVYIPSESLFILDYLYHAVNVPDSVWRYLLRHEPQLRCWFDRPLPEAETIAGTLVRIHESAAQANGSQYWGQKTPRFIRHREKLDASFTDISWILLYRDPRAVVASMLTSGQHTNSLAGAVKRWKIDNEPIVSDFSSNNIPANTLIISYEDMIECPDIIIGKILNFLQLQQMSFPALKARGVPVFFSRSRFPINTVRTGLSSRVNSITAWTSTLSHRAVRYIEAQCAPEMQLLGYSYESEAAKPSQRFLDKAYAHLGVIQDPWIIFRYLCYWPEYLFWTALRKTLFHLFSLCPKRK